MSQISKALKKVQELRQNGQMAKAAPVVPAAQVPIEKEPVVSTPIVETPVVETPVIKAPVVEKLVIEKPAVKAPVVEAPVAQQAPIAHSPAPAQNALIPMLVAGTVAAVLISTIALVMMIMAQSNQDKVLGLQRTVEIQNKKINYLGTLKGQINNLNVRMDNENRSLKDQIESVSSDSRDHYDNLKEALVDSKQEIGFLDNYTKKLDQRIEAVSAPVRQADTQPAASPDATSPSSGT